VIPKSIAVSFFLAVEVALCGPVGVGVKAGIPATGLVMSSDQDSGAFPAKGGAYVIGPSAEIRFPLGIGIEVDALYRGVSYPSGSSWEFPILAKYRLPVHGLIRPFVAGGASFERNDVLQANQVGPARTTKGYVFGGGVETKLGPIRIAPEFRYTHWTGDFAFRTGDFASGTGNFAFRESNLTHRNNLEFLLGISF
jgi:hypothetical protein